MARSKASSIFKFKSAGPADTARLAALFAPRLKGGAVLYLEGPIGSGKTFFVRELAAALGSPKLPVSASFNIMRSYRGRLKLYHFDLFRAGEADMENIGLAEYLGREDGITAVEWPGAAAWELEAFDPLKIEFALVGGDTRLIKIKANGPLVNMLAEIEAKWLKK